MVATTPRTVSLLASQYILQYTSFLFRTIGLDLFNGCIEFYHVAIHQYLNSLLLTNILIICICYHYYHAIMTALLRYLFLALFKAVHCSALPAGGERKAEKRQQTNGQCSQLPLSHCNLPPQGFSVPSAQHGGVKDSTSSSFLVLSSLGSPGPTPKARAGLWGSGKLSSGRPQ